MKKKWIALIPAYEPKPFLIHLLREVYKAGLQAVVVDDGSQEAFAKLFEQAALYAVVLVHPQNRGKGCALKTGLTYIREHIDGEYIVLTLDADGQHRVSDGIKLCSAAEEHPNALILGSRGFGDNVPFKSWFGNVVTRFIYKLTTGIQIYDTQTGLRAFSWKLVPKLLSVAGERYEYEMNVLLECSGWQIPVREIEIETIYIDNNAGSHFDTLKDSYRIYKEILKFSVSSFIGFLVDYTLYGLLLLLTAGFGAGASLRISNITARIVSSGVNYTMNRKLVFKSRNSIAKSALQYFTLAGVILLGNTLLLSLLVEKFAFNQYSAKICAEIFFFLLSWFVQKRVIFQKGGVEKFV